MRRELAENEHGRQVVVKCAETADEAARLRREADLLEVATHPGLVELAGLEDGTAPVLRTVSVDGPSLAAGDALEIEEVAGVAAAVASILADLHGMGLVHGAVAPAHVLVDSDGRPVLCGLGYGGLTGEPCSQTPDLPEAFVDPTRADAVVLDPSADVFGVGALILFLLARTDGRARSAGGEALRAAAQRATAPDALSRPTARQLADAVHDAVTSPRLPCQRGADAAAATSRPDPVDVRHPLEGWRQALGSPRPVAPRRPLRLAAAGAFAAVSVVGALAVVVQARPAASPSRSVAAPATTVAAPTTAVAPAITTAVAPATNAPPTTAVAVAVARPRPAPAGCETTAGPLAADVDGDGCPENLRFGGGVVVAGALRWSVGETGDEFAVGDWACSGARSLAVLRPRTGEVFAFATWAAPGRDVDAPLIGTVAGGRALRAADLDGDGCNELVVERAAGAPVVMRAPRTRP